MTETTLDRLGNERLGELVQAAAAGDQAAWTALVTAHTALLRRVAAGYRLSDAQVDDVVQTAWLRLVEHVAGLRSPEKVTGWLVTTVRRECLTLLRAAQREQPQDSDLDGFWGSVDGVEDDVVREEECRRVRGAVRRLPERQRQVVTLLTWAPELDYRQVGSSLAMPVGSIGPTRGRALVRLREMLEAPVAAQPTAA
jgi:RNA polymerase sigma factor (sigma-70 family)